MFLGLFSNDDIHSWAGAHDLKVSGQFQVGLQLSLGLVSKDDIHCWTGAHDLKVSGQFQVGLQLLLGSFFFQAEDGIRDHA